MPVYSGSNKIKEIWAGSSKINEVWAGSSLVWKSNPAIGTPFSDLLLGIGWAKTNTTTPNKYSSGFINTDIVTGMPTSYLQNFTHTYPEITPPSKNIKGFFGSINNITVTIPASLSKPVRVAWFGDSNSRISKNGSAKTGSGTNSYSIPVTITINNANQATAPGAVIAFYGNSNGHIYYGACSSVSMEYYYLYKNTSGTWVHSKANNTDGWKFGFNAGDASHSIVYNVGSTITKYNNATIWSKTDIVPSSTKSVYPIFFAGLYYAPNP